MAIKIPEIPFVCGGSNLVMYNHVCVSLHDIIFHFLYLSVSPTPCAVLLISWLLSLAHFQ